jgi:hypothetical protein
MLRILSAVGLALALVACGDSSGNGADGYAGEEVRLPEFAAAPAPAMMEFAKSMDTASRGGSSPEQQIIQPDPNGGGGAQPGAAPLMAYTYGWNFAVPTGEMQNLLNAHKKLCEDAGPSKCYITNSNIDGIGKESSSGYLSMRATEDWVRQFEKGVDDGLKPFGASVYSNNRSAEELTAQIVDNEARLVSMVAYRDSLQQMLRDKPGKLSDLLEIQQTLAQAQGDIDSRQSVLAALKLRVSMSVLNFSYQPEYAAASESIWRPLGDAFGDFVPSLARTLAATVKVVAAILPVVLVAGLLLWALVALFSWRGKGKKQPAARPLSPTSPTKPAGSSGGSSGGP